MEEESEIITVPVIPTITEKLQRDQFKEALFCLGAESLLHNHEHLAEGELKLEIKNYFEIQKNLNLSRTNLVLNEPFKMITELEPIIGGNSLLIIDTTRPEKSRDLEELKKLELGKKVNIGYTYLPQYAYISESTSLEEIKLVLEEKRVFKKIEHECFDGPLSFTALGVLLISNLMEENHFESLMLSGLKKFSLKFNCPIILDLEFKNNNEDVLKWIEGNIEPEIRSNILVINLETFVQNSQNFEKEKITELTYAEKFDCFSNFANLGFKTQFPFFRYLRRGISVEGISEILQNILNNCNKVGIESLFVSTSVEYKTDLCEYGGPGFQKFVEFYQKTSSSQEIKSKIFKDNCLNFYTWWIPKKKEAKFGDLVFCSSCGAETYDASKWFSKDGKFFDKPPCFKKYLKSKK